ncbi:MAG: hypothetical protein H0W68_09995 [Gemmatimonadaceae bacterium]|nr:hypothetical protein [Gemmatimonadaceae bacterium]
MRTPIVPRLLPPFSPISDVPDLLRDQLQTTLGAGYTLGRELGGGGMSRVYVAHEEALGHEGGGKIRWQRSGAMTAALRAELEAEIGR